jgi:hypothetical protein
MNPVFRFPILARGLWLGLLLALCPSLRSQILPPPDQPARVALLYPVSGAVLGSDNVHFEAVTHDPDGAPLTVVEFVADDQVVATSDRSNEIFPGVIGLRIPHKAAWPNAPVGVHVVWARALVGDRVVARSEPIRVIVQESDPLPPVTTPPIVTIYATESEVLENDPKARLTYEFRRTGDVAAPLTVLFVASGTATPDVDYAPADGSSSWRLPPVVDGSRDIPFLRQWVIPAGASTARLMLVPVADDRAEGVEDLVLAVIPSNRLPTGSSDVLTYLPGSPAVARGLIRDGDPLPPVDLPLIGIVATQDTTAEPSPFTKIRPGLITVTRKGDATQPLRVFYSVGGTARNGVDYQFLDGDLTLGAGEASGEILVAAIEDHVAEPDETVIVRLRPDRTYQIAESAVATDTIFNTDDHDAASLTFNAPASGSVFPSPANINLVLTAVDPAGYISRVEFFANGRPIGTSEIAFIRAPDPGTPIQHTLEWKDVPAGGYGVTAVAVDTKGVKVISEPLRLGVNRVVEPPRAQRHPADVTPADDSLSGEEIGAYADAWRSGAKFGADSTAVPMAYLTRAAFLWRAGGNYLFNPAVGQLPLAWVSTDPKAEPRPGIDFLPPGGLGGGTDAGGVIPPRLPMSYVLAEVFHSTGETRHPLLVRSGPIANTRSHALEVQFTEGTELTEISDAGVFDKATGILRWGPFHDDVPRRLTATVASTTPFRFRGFGSFDGRDVLMVEIAPTTSTPGGDGDAPRIATVNSLGNGGMQLVVIGGSATTETDVEVSSDLVHWTRIARMPGSAEATVQMDDDAGQAPVRFYRALRRVR